MRNSSLFKKITSILILICLLATPLHSFAEKDLSDEAIEEVLNEWDQLVKEMEEKLKNGPFYSSELMEKLKDPLGSIGEYIKKEGSRLE